jgi:hypothetical protein
MAGRPAAHVARGFGSLRVSARDTGSRTVVEQTLKGQQSQESTDGRPHPGQGHEVVAERTPGGSKASKRACRPLTGEPSVGGKGTERAVHSHECAEATGLAIEGIRRPGSCVHGGFTSGWASPGKGSSRTEKSIVKLLQALRRRQSNANPQGSTRPARAGTAPREGKAL